MCKLKQAGYDRNSSGFWNVLHYEPFREAVNDDNHRNDKGLGSGHDRLQPASCIVAE
jgi:hypothetical protein